MTDPELICPGSGEPCDNARMCGFVNEPLDLVIPHIRQEVGGIRWRIAETALQRAIDTQANLLTVDLPTHFDREGTGTVCPDAIVGGEFGNKHGQNAASNAVRNILSRCVKEVIVDLRSFGN